MVVLNMEVEEIKCPKCGFKNAYGTKYCFKCHHRLEKSYISCPKCAKKNDPNASRCSSCGFNLKRKRLSLFACLCISILIGVALYFAVRFKDESILKNVRIVYYVIAGLIIVGVIYRTLSYGKKEQLKFDAEEELTDTNPRLKMMKLISSIAAIIVVLFIALFIIFKFILKKF